MFLLKLLESTTIQKIGILFDVFVCLLVALHVEVKSWTLVLRGVDASVDGSKVRIAVALPYLITSSSGRIGTALEFDSFGDRFEVVDRLWIGKVEAR